jgi:cysteine desulfuration protein SufE
MVLIVNKLNDIVADFEFLDDWEDRYRFVIELGKTLAPLAETDRSASNKVQGCVSQVWLATVVDRSQSAANPVLRFAGDSDAHIVRGLIAILFAIYSEKSAKGILAIDPHQTFAKLGLLEHLTPQRSNGFLSMVARIRRDAERALAPAGEAAR